MDRVCGLDGYTASKVVAEQILRRLAAHADNIRVRIFRPGAVCAHSRTGSFNRTDFVTRYLMEVIRGGGYHISSSGILEMIPVDEVVRMIIPAVIEEREAQLVVEDIENRWGSLTFAQLGQVMKRLGMKAKGIPMKQFKERVKADPTSPLFPLISYLKESAFIGVDSSRQQEPQSKLPAVDDNYILLYTRAIRAHLSEGR